MKKLTDTAETVLKKRYYLEGEDWTALCLRVAKAVASVEKDAAHIYWQNKYFTLIHDLFFLPNSPCLMNAGTELGQLSACFVLPIDDSLAGIFDAVKWGALVNKTGGGTGYSFSRLRPKEAAVCSTNGVASGPISFASVFDQATEVIKQGGRRRGANMGALRVDHPDIMEFINAKRDKSKLTNFNFSVAITDDFMLAVKTNSVYPLIDPSTGGGCIANASEVFDAIIDAAWESGEPGILFIDAANRKNPTPHLGEFETTNPCCTGDTQILTLEHGYKRIDHLIGRHVHVWNGFEWSLTMPTVTGTNKEVCRVSFSDGSELSCTMYHGFYLADGSKVEAKDLQIGDSMIKHEWPLLQGGEDVSKIEAYTAGFFAGDGSVHSASGVKDIFLYGEKRGLVNYLDCLKTYECDGGNRLCVRVPEKNYKKGFVPGAEWSVESRLNWLAGIIDSDGCLNDKGGSVAVSSINKYFLMQIKLMLNTLGVYAHVGVMKKACEKEMPDGKGGQKEYYCHESYRLTIPASVVKKLREIGLSTNRVDVSIANPDRSACRFIRVTGIDRGGMIADKVYCFNEEKRHSGIFNGVITAQCGEQWLLPFESCNLGSINLGLYVVDTGPIVGIDREKLADDVRTAVRFLDAVIDVSKFPLPEITEMTRKTRKIGLGIMGLHDALIKMEIPYASVEGRNMAAEIMSFIHETAENASLNLADEKGVCPAFKKDRIRRFPRNASLTSIQPTGTVSMIANCSSGCEPYFAVVNRKNVMDGESFLMVNPLFEETAKREGWYSQALMEKVAATGTVLGHAEIPMKWQEIFRCAQDISVKDHIEMQAVLQNNGVDASISKTINMPEVASKEDVKNAYIMGWELGCKGLTVYRDGCRDGQVLTVGEAKKENKPYFEIKEAGFGGKWETGDSIEFSISPIPTGKMELPDIISAKRYRLKDNGGETIYIIVCYTESGYPVEVFAKFPFDNRVEQQERATMWATTCRLVSLSLRSGIAVEEIIKQLDRASGSMFDLPAQLSKILKGFLEKQAGVQYQGGNCPECSIGTIVFQEGCMTCNSCGSSKCS